MNLNVLKILTVLIIISSQVFAEENNKELSFYTGTFDVIDKEGDDKTSLFGIEHNIIQGANGILNGKVLRFKNEPVRHKMLDALGDIALAGYPIIGHYVGYKAGHGITHGLLRSLFADDENFDNHDYYDDPGII